MNKLTTRNRLLAGSVLAILAGIILVVIGLLQFTVHVAVDGGPILEVRVWGRTVGGALRAAGIDIRAGDMVLPHPTTALVDGMVIEVQHASPIEIEIGGERLSVISAERRPANLLREAGLQLYPGDIVLVQGIPVDPQDEIAATAFTAIELRQTIRIVLSEGVREEVAFGAGPTLAHVLEQGQVPLYASDVLAETPHTLITENAVVERLPGRVVEIRQGDAIVQTRTAGSSVGAALAAAGFSLQGLDYSEPGEDVAIPDDGVIDVVRVEERVLLVQELVAFSTEFQALANVPIDTLQVVQAGEYGLQAQRVRVRLENGEEQARTVEDEWLVKAPLPRIEGYGTQISIRTLDTPDGTIEYWRAVEFYATSYSPANSGTPVDAPWYGHVYCGGLMQNGFVGVDLDYVPCGTPLYIPGYGFAVAMDTGAIDGAWVDLGYLDEDYVPWHQFVTVYFLTPVPSADNIAWIIPPGRTR